MDNAEKATFAVIATGSLIIVAQAATLVKRQRAERKKMAETWKQFVNDINADAQKNPH